MCGIAGRYGDAVLDVEDALDRIAHRGPDGRGVVEADGAVHGHVRLAIQDPTPASDQPFRYGDVTLSYVGELWERDRVRELLEREGCEFSTTGDTEVVAAALASWGPGALASLDGMFALAWTDHGGTYLARDRFGKVPLYWLPGTGALFGGGAAWASERKAFGERAGDVMAVPPAHYVNVSTGAIRPYYALPESDLPSPESDAERVLALLRRGVRKRLVSDVPVCCLVSGGLDSAAVLALVREVAPDVVGYHTAFDEGSEDLAVARLVCERLGVPLRVEWVDDPTEADLRAAIHTVEIPYKVQVEIALLAIPLARRMRADGFHVCLTGEGADELFGGYGSLARRASSDDAWRTVRRERVGKMARSDFMRVNKALMAHGVEPRLPFLERELVESVLALGRRECPPGKGLLKAAVKDLLPTEVVTREKQTFQGGAGMTSYCERRFAPVRQTYNAVARDLFGMVPRD